MYGLGVAAADFDNDGDADLYVTGLGASRLFRNDGGARFTDRDGARPASAIPASRPAQSWFDYDRDGKLDLFVAHYVQWSVETDLFCTLDGKLKSYCTPESYKGQSPTLYRNRGDGTFEDVTRKAGLFDAANKMLGVALIDFDNDGWLDVFGANDTQPNRLYRNKGNGTFVDVGVMAGVAFNEAGVARAGMGVDAADYDGSGRQSLDHRQFLERDDGALLERGERAVHRRGAGVHDRPRVAAAPDVRLLLRRRRPRRAARHLRAPTATSPTTSRACSRPSPTRSRRTCSGTSGGRSSRTSRRGSARRSRRPSSARGAAYGDYDNDGDLDLLITANNGPARLLRNDGAVNHRLRVTLAGHLVQPRRDRRQRQGPARSGRAARAHGQDRLELSLAERAAADLRPGRGHEGRPGSK